MTPSRRDLLRALGAGAAASALAAVGCGGKVRRAPTLVEPGAHDRLVVAYDRLRTAWPRASVWLAIRERTVAVAGSDARGTARTRTITLVLRGADERRAVERVLDDTTEAAVSAAVTTLAAAGPGGARGPLPRTERRVADVARDPALTSAGRWVGALDEILRRADASATSRVVWRAAHAIVDDVRTWFVGDGHDLAQRRVAVRTGLTLLAWDGGVPMIGEAAAARAGGLEALGLDDVAIEDAARRALERTTPVDAPSGPAAVLLDPSVTAALIGAGIGDVLTSGRWRRPDLRARGLLGAPVAAAGVTIVDDPGAGGFGGYALDDEGTVPQRTALVDGGVLAAVLTDAAGAAGLGRPATGHGRRDLRDGALAARASDLALAPGAADDDALRAALGDGLIVEDVAGVSVDPASWRAVVRARRARRVAGGQRTGHVWNDVELRGDVPALLGGITAIGATTTTRALDDVSSVTAPAIVTRGELLAWRRG